MKPEKPLLWQMWVQVEEGVEPSGDGSESALPLILDFETSDFSVDSLQAGRIPNPVK